MTRPTWAAFALLLLLVAGCDRSAQPEVDEAVPGTGDEASADEVVAPYDGAIAAGDPPTATPPSCNPGETQSNCQDIEPYSIACYNDDIPPSITGQVWCAQQTCSCTDPNGATRSIRGEAACNACPEGSKGTPLPPLQVISE